MKGMKNVNEYVKAMTKRGSQSQRRELNQNRKLFKKQLKKLPVIS